MILVTPGFLTTSTCILALDRVLQNQDQWADGRDTAGADAARVKNNKQWFVPDLANALREAFDNEFEVLNPRFVIYQRGDYYGRHRDAKKQRGGAAKYSFTIPISEGYDGGELVIYDPPTEHRIKEGIGTLISYPNEFEHEVTEVLTGCRIAIVGWLGLGFNDV